MADDCGVIIPTKRERDVLRLLVDGHTDAEIADALGLQRRSVSDLVSQMLRKFGMRSRVALAVEASRREWIAGE